jgi:hypothetical protein
VFLHQAIIIDGQTESTLSADRIKTIKSMELTPNGFIIVHARGKNIIPASNAKNMMVQE